MPRTERKDFARAACAPGSPVLEHFWWLSDPLWSVPGNDRYVVHQARRTLIALRSVLGRDERYVWDIYATGLSMRETVLRYGWPNYTFWPAGQVEGQMANRIDYGGLGPTAAATQVQQFGAGTRRGTASARVPTPRAPLNPLRIVRLPYTVKEYTTDQTALIPRLSAILEPFRITASDWSLANPDPREPDNWWPQEFQQLRRPLLPLAEGQLGFWRRDSTVRVAHIVELPMSARATLDTATDLAMLAGGVEPIGTQILAHATLTSNDAIRFSGTVPPGLLVLSAELVTQAPRGANYRNRFGARAPSTLRDMTATDLALSEPVFVRLEERGAELPISLDDVTARMASSLTFRASDLIALYWESYGFPEKEPLEVVLQLKSAEGANVVQRLGALIGVNGQPDSVSIRWVEREPLRVDDADATIVPVAVHRVGLDLSPLDPGAYVVSIELRTRSNRTARAERRFVIRKP